jgi:opacity protein-like surface antigen
VSGDSDFRSYGIVGHFGWRVGDSPVTFGPTFGIYAGGASEDWSGSGSYGSYQVSYAQPLSITIGARVGYDFTARFLGYIEAGVVGTRHELTARADVFSNSFAWHGTGESVGWYVGGGGRYRVSEHFSITAGLQYRDQDYRGQVVQSTWAGSVGFVLHF